MVTASPDTADPRQDSAQRTATFRARRRARMGRFLWILGSITAVMHVPVALGVGELARREGAPHPWLLGIAWSVVGAGLFVSRIRAGMPDNPRHPLIVRLLDVPYFVHWCAALWTLIPALVLSLVLPLVDLLRGVPVAVPVGAYMWTYLSGLVVSGYGVLVRRRWFRVVTRDVKIAGLPAAFDGLRIAHLS